jgi:hypothetical protein
MSPTQEEPKDTDTEYIRQLREDLGFELASPLGLVSYPDNLTVYNYIDYVFCPTLCYEIEYPRTSHIRWMEVFYKTLAVFGCIFLMVITSEEFILPVLDASAARLHHSTSALDFALIVAETVGRLLFPFMITFLLVFLVIFEYVLGAFAELTRKSFSSSKAVHPLMLLQASRIANSTQTGGTAATGSSFLVNGTSQYTTSSAVTYTLPRKTTCRGHLQPPSLSSFPHLRMS